MGKMTMTAALVLSILTLAGCKKDKDEPTPAAPPPPAPPTYSINSDPTFAATLSGSAVLFKHGENNIENTTNPLVSMSPATYRSSFRQQYDTKASVSLGRLTYSGQSPTEEEFMNFFAPGPRSFSTQLSSQGVNISVPPDDSSILSSAYATQPATSNFTITDAIPYDDGSGITKVKVRATFNCAMGGSDSATLTNGQFVGVFSMN